jgi:hypothetical protein
VTYFVLTLRFMSVLLVLLLTPVWGTIDLNFDELEYLANHLLLEECRRLVAAAHFKSYIMPNSLDLAGKNTNNPDLL